jgi:hypothetical protein
MNVSHETAGKSDDWYTPAYIFKAMGVRFDLDVAAPRLGPRHVPCDDWLCDTVCGLSRDWRGFVWMNPPFGHQSTKRLWLRKFFDHGDGVALLPDRTSAPWWQEFAPLADAVLFVSPKVKFERPNGTVGEQPGTGTTLFAAGERGVKALQNARSLGSLFRPMQAAA